MKAFNIDADSGRPGLSLSCAVTDAGDNQHNLTLIEEKGSDGYTRSSVWTHELAVKCTDSGSTCRLTEYRGNYKIVMDVGHGAEILIGSLIQHSSKKIREQGNGIPLDCRGDTAWIIASP